MIQRRRARLALLALVSMGAAAGCTTFTDNGVAARVGEAELTNEQFSELTAQLEQTQTVDPLPDDRQRVDGQLARSAVANWIAVQLADDAGVIERYANGVDDLGVACVFVLPTTDLTTAQQLVDELEGGADWFDVVEREAPGTPAGGRQQCLPAESLGAEIMTMLAGMSPDDPYRVVDAQQALVVRAQDPGELFGIDFLTALQAVDPDTVNDILVSGDDADVHVDPRVGTFDASRLSVDPLQ